MASPLSRRERRAARVAGNAARLAAGASAPFSGVPTLGPINAPVPTWTADQPPPAPSPLVFVPGYHDRTLTAPMMIASLDGFDLARARNAISMHDQGIFWESSALARAVTRYGPVYASLGVRCAPMISLPRLVKAGPRGLSRDVGQYVTAQLAPSAGLQPSEYFPSTLYGAIEIDLAMMGFAVLQHVYGDEDEDGIRPIYTRRWPTWATTYYRERRTFQVTAAQGNFDIINGDGKFTLIAKTDEPHLQGAIRSLAAETIDGVLTKQARADWIERFSDPKCIATMQEKVALGTPEGDAFVRAMASMRNRGGFGLLPFGGKVDWVGLKAEASSVFNDALNSVGMTISAILTGTDLSAGTGGVYKSPMFWGILRSTVGDDIAAILRGINSGHVRPFTRFNFGAGIEENIKRGTWIDPVLDIPLPDPEADERAKAYAAACKLHLEIAKGRFDAGFDFTQDDSDALALKLSIDPPVLAPATDGAPIEEWEVKYKLVAPDELRKQKGLPAMPDGAGSLDRLAKERIEGKDESGKAASVVDPALATEQDAQDDQQVNEGIPA